MSGIDETHDPALRSWVDGTDDHPEFPVQNLPLGIVSPPGGRPRAAVAIGDHALDLTAVAALLPERVVAALSHPTLNALFALPPADRTALRRRLSSLLSDGRRRAAVKPALHRLSDCRLHLPAQVGDYTDFYAGIHHAEAVGRLFRPDSPLLPNYKHVPIGYHGRASTVRVSGEPVRRPSGQRRAAGAEQPDFLPTARLDYELELGVWIGSGNPDAQPIPVGEAGDHLAGLCLLNDWSARDVQTWEYQPLGPFLAKSFATTVSPWVVTTDALAPFRTAPPPRPEGDPAPLPYLRETAPAAYAIDLEVAILTPAMREARLPPHPLGRSDAARDLYWTLPQLVAHHSSNGCVLRPGDLFGTGTVSGPGPGESGSLLEATAGGTRAVHLPNGEERLFLENGDEVLLRARAARDGFRTIGFGPCRAAVLPAG